ncbi:hypothetical protein SAMN05421595_0111 [Austwickia chelonae]|uniref:Uncharacterized protein n=1 Tax=Austwickia chelonae NBRC 105200 TaxID=1184607 RepID=K6VU77_9MICO|nr:hypothetical protein [Austwickia chelonae]GAB78900.1 hypothetical protein AUCHE_17_01120 [Austwickia chelonae NBRC 105200]SEV86154.1 hypothetical protein SAMN05421595_0111 [Austwickia chelonae]
MKGLTDVRAAALLIGMLGLTYALPYGLIIALGVSTSTVPPGHRETFRLEESNAPDGKRKQLELTAPTGWQRQDRVKPSDVTYTQGNRSVRISVTEKIGDPQTAMNRHIRQAGLSGELLHLGGPEISTGSGFRGQRCAYTTADSSRHGQCAMITRDSTMVVLISSDETGKDPLDLHEIVASIDVKDTTR